MQIPRYTIDTLPFLKSNIAPGSTLQTDESRIYSRVKRDYFTHEFVNHSKLEYVRAGVHTNTIEGFWGHLKRSLDGTYHCVSAKYLQLYVNEFVEFVFRRGRYLSTYCSSLTGYLT